MGGRWRRGPGLVLQIYTWMTPGVVGWVGRPPWAGLEIRRPNFQDNHLVPVKTHGSEPERHS